MSEPNAEFERLLAAAMEGLADEAQIETLRTLLREDRDLRAEYLAQFSVHALLQWHAGTVGGETEAPAPELIPMSNAEIPARPPALLWWLAAAAAVTVLGVVLWRAQPVSGPPRIARQAPVVESIPAPAVQPAAVPGVEFEVLEAAQVVLSEGTLDFRPGARLAASRLQLKAGMLRFRLTSGAVVAVRGPADVALLDAMHLRVARGRLTTDVGDNAKGFVIETAQANVVDLGTKFGVDVAGSGHTDVVVFQGKVELFDRQKVQPGAGPMAQLIEGEAVRVDGEQQLSRIANVSSGQNDEDWSTDGTTDPTAVIASVRDNLHPAGARYFYRIIRGGMQEDAQAFIAKRHEWNGRDASGMPPWLIGADLVQTFGTGKANAGLELVVTLARPGVLYVLIDDRNPPPAWLEKQFANTGAKVGLENAPQVESGLSVARGPGAGSLAPFAVWQREMPEGGSVTLGAPPAVSGNRPNWMYGLAARAL